MPTPTPADAAVQPQHSGVHMDFQSINADFYNLTDAQGWPVAGLLVLLDRTHRPVRAELHLNTETTGQTEEMAMRQAINLIEQRYPTSAAPGTRDARVDLRILRTYQERDTVQVGLLPGQPRSSADRPPYLVWGVVGIGAVLLILALVWLVGSLFGGDGAPTTTDLPTRTPVVQSQPGAEQSAVQPATAGDGASTAPGSAVVAETPIPPQTNGLASSRNAVDFSLGQRARIRPGLTLTLRSQPGADAGEQVGFMQDSQAATLIGGPVWMPGLSDTIVWWYARLDTGQEAWIPANTSELTLLESAPWTYLYGFE